MWDQDEEDNNPYASFQRRGSNSSDEDQPTATANQFARPTTPPSDHSPVREQTADAYFRRQDLSEDEDQNEQQQRPVQRKQGGYDSRVEQILYEQPDQPIVITQAGKNVEGGGSYIAYTIRTGDVEVRRRYRDFASLRTTLVNLHPTFIIPPIPEKHSIADYAAKPTKAKEDEGVIEHRKRMLASFLNRCRRLRLVREDGVFWKFLDPNASWSEVLLSQPVSSLPKSNLKSPPLDAANPTPGHNFLPVPSSTAKLRSAKDANREFSGTPTSPPQSSGRPTSSSGADQDHAKFPSSAEQMSEQELDPFFASFENASRELENLLQGDVEKVNRRTLSHLAGMSESLSELGARLNSFSLSEQSATLAAAIEKVGQAVDSTFIATGDMSPSLSASFSEPMRESAQFAGIVRSVLRYRILKRIQGEMTRDELEKKKLLLDQLEGSEMEAQRLEQHLERSGFGAATPPRRSNSSRSSQERGGRMDEDTASIDSDFPSGQGEGGPPLPSASQGLPPRSEPSSPTGTHRKNGSGNFVTNKIFGRINHAIHGIVDVDPERTRRDQIGKTKESLVQLEQALEVSDKDVRDASIGVMKSLQQFQLEKEEDLRKYMIAYARVHIDWAKRNLASWEEAKDEVDKIDLLRFCLLPGHHVVSRATHGGWLSFTTSSSKKRKTATYARRGSSTSWDKQDHSLFTTDDHNAAVTSPGSSPHPSSLPSQQVSPTTPRFLPPHLHDEVLDASPGSKSGGFGAHHRGESAGDQTSAQSGEAMSGVESAKDSTLTDNTVSHSGPNSPPPVSAAENGVRQLGVGARSSSPAKRSASEREDDDSEGQNGNNNLDHPPSPSALRSPRKPGQSHVSPMPSRFKNPTTSFTEKMEQDDNREPVSQLGGSGASSTTQGDHIMTSTSPTSTSATSVENDSDRGKLKEDASTAELPSYDDQMSEIKRITYDSSNMHEGSKGFIISNTWVMRVQSRTSQGKHESHEKSIREGDVGPVDNSDIVMNDHFYGDLRDEFENPFVPLRPGLQIDQDFVVVPEKAWNLIMEWYSVAEESHIIVRYARTTTEADATSANLQYELYPPICTIQKLRNDESGLTAAAMREKELSAAHLVASRDERFQSFLKRIKAAVGIDMSTKVQVWKILETTVADDGRSGMPTPASSRSGSPVPQRAITKVSPKLVIDLNSFTTLEDGLNREKIRINDETANDNYNGNIRLHTIGFPPFQTLVLEEQLREAGEDEFVTDKLKKSAAQHGINLSAPNKGVARAAYDNSKLGAGLSSARRSPTPSGVITRGRVNKRGKTRGCTGLVNLGNTCYMNSALQCIRSIEELSIYFLEKKYQEEINPSNPLGHGGQVAKAYGTLIDKLFSDSTSFSPQDFRRTIGRIQPLFSGYGQQDSQELLSFLVDALHEDLNRIVKKPYMENPESDDNTVNDPNAIYELGEKFRYNHRARNDSVAMDLFNGFYKNTMICPECDKISVTFDPYSLLTLQLPIEQPFQHTVSVYLLNGPPVMIDVDMDKNSNIRSLKEYVGKRVGIEGNRLVMAEQFNGKFYKVFQDTEVLSEAAIQANDKLLLCELNDHPTNWPPYEPKKDIRVPMGTNGISPPDTADTPPMDSALGDRMAIPLLHRFPKTSVSWSLELVPLFILVTREEARDFDSILRKALQRVATLTTRNMFAEGDADDYWDTGAAAAAKAGSDMSIVDEEEGSSTDDRKVQTRSLESEEGFVDVSMSDRESGNDGEPANEHQHSRSQTSKILDPDFPIQDDLRHYFDMKIYSFPNEPIPCGWSKWNDHDNLPSLESRRASLSRDQSRRGSFGSIDGNINDDQTPESSISDEDELSETGPSNNIGIANFKNFGPNNEDDSSSRTGTIKLKGPRTSMFNNGKAPNPDSHPEDDYLIRFGEGLILEWTKLGIDQLFEKFGERSYIDAEKVPDPELEAKRSRRIARKKQGITLGECFEETSKSEILSDDNAWHCPRCKEHRRATKILEIWTVPDILVLHLKRFSSQSRMRDKVDVLVDFPVEGLDLSGKVGLPEDKSLVYDLFAVDNHYGGLGGGHYTAYAQNFVDKKWYDYNDQMVTMVSPDSVVTRAAYLLFYRRRSDKPLGGEFLEELTNNAWATADPSSIPGEDPRLDDLSSNESSNVSLGQGAEVNHQPGARHLLGSAGGLHDLESTARSALNDDPPPDYDEGIGMDEDADNPLPTIEGARGFIGPTMPSWSFETLTGSGTNAPPGSSTGNSPIGSDVAEAGEAGEEHDLENLPDDDDDGGAVPIPLGQDTEYEDPEVAEIKVSSDNEYPGA